MKKLLSLLLALIIVFSFTACGEGEKGDAQLENKGVAAADEAESVVGKTFEFYKANYGEEKEAEMEIVYTFKADNTVDALVGKTDMNKPFTQKGTKVSIDFGNNGGLEELELINGELVKDLGYGKEYFRLKE